jgi:hypothetical protein
VLLELYLPIGSIIVVVILLVGDEYFYRRRRAKRNGVEGLNLTREREGSRID